MTWQAQEREQARMLRSGIVVLVDAAYRDGWAGIAGVICFPGDRLQERLFVTVIPCESSNAAERAAVRRGRDELKRRRLEGVVLTDSLAAARGFRDSVVRKVRRGHVRPAHLLATAELRFWLRGVSAGRER